MNESKILTGYQLVEKGATKLDASLPEVGMKDVIPNGSWLEQKQIQASLEARKHLIEVERIEKCGVLSHAEWREDLQLAEVIQKAGGYWQYFGHNVGKHLYLNPEEALFLMEVNCLLLKFNEVTMSLQQAYAILLNSKISLLQYKVFASLSRLGYKIYRHKEIPLEDKLSNTTVQEDVIFDKDFPVTPNNNLTIATNDTDVEMIIEDEIPVTTSNIEQDCKEIDNGILRNTFLAPQNDDNNVQCNEEPQIPIKDVPHTVESVKPSLDECSSTCNESVCMETDMNTEDIANPVQAVSSDEKDKGTNADVIIKTNNIPNLTLTKNISIPLQNLINRQMKPLNLKHEHFDNIPDLLQKQVITINAPDQEHIPKNIFVNKISYVLDMEMIKNKSDRPKSSNYSVTDEVNGAHIRRLRSSSTDTPVTNLNSSFPSNVRYSNTNFQYRPFNLWRPRNNQDFYQYTLFQRSFFHPRFHYIPRVNHFILRQQFPHSSNFFNIPTPPLIRSNTSSSRKRTLCNSKEYHVSTIRKLALRLKNLVNSGNRQQENIASLQKLIITCNIRYKTRLRLTEQFDLIDDTPVVETIEIDDDAESKSKKRRVHDKNGDPFVENLKKLKEMALKFKELESRNQMSTRLRRAFSNMIKTFNKSYNADIYMNNDCEIYDRRHISLDSSSDSSDCVIEEQRKPANKLPNPFNLLRRRSESNNSKLKETTVGNDNSIEAVVPETTYSESTIKTFGSWLPDSKDFGRAEVLPRNHNRLLDSKEEEYIYDFLKSQPDDFDNWLDLKISFLRSIEESKIESSMDFITTEFSDASSILKKLNMITRCTDVPSTSLCIDYDVYNRDVQNFRKSNRPKPHFRIICISESAGFPSGKEIAGLHAKYEDGVTIVLAVVGVASISYLQINPTNLPVCISVTES